LDIPRSSLYAGNLNIDSLIRVCEFFEIEPTELLYTEFKTKRRSIFMKAWVRPTDLSMFVVNINSGYNHADELARLIRKISHVDIKYDLLGKRIVPSFWYELQSYVDYTSSIIVRSDSSSNGTYYNTLLDQMEIEKKVVISIVELFNDAFENMPEDWVKLFYYRYFLKYNRQKLLKTDIVAKNNIFKCIAAVSQAIRDSVKINDYTKIFRS
ncbi:MAG: hypothetical protein RR531_12410, partial [Longicatena sp.]